MQFTLSSCVAGGEGDEVVAALGRDVLDTTEREDELDTATAERASRIAIARGVV